MENQTQPFNVDIRVAGQTIGSITVEAKDAEHARILGSKLVTLHASKAYKPLKAEENN